MYLRTLGLPPFPDKKKTAHQRGGQLEVVLKEKHEGTDKDQQELEVVLKEKKKNFMANLRYAVTFIPSFNIDIMSTYIQTQK